MFRKFLSQGAEPGPAADAAPGAALTRRRIEVWVEYKRLHLGFVQALNSLAHGHSSMMTLIKHAMLAEFEARKLTGEEPEGASALIVGDAMRRAINHYRAAYGRVSRQTFNEKALSGLAEEADPHLIQLMLALASAPISAADQALIEAARHDRIDDVERVRRFTSEIAKIQARLRTHFIDLAKRSGLA